MKDGSGAVFNMDGSAYLRRVLCNLKSHACRNGHRRKDGCLGQHEGCYWFSVWTRIVANAKDDTFFTGKDADRPVRTINGLTKEEAIVQLQAWVAADPALRFRDQDTYKDIDQPGQYGRRLTHEAVLARDKDKLEDLIAMGADFSLRDNNGQTPYQLALQEGFADIVALLEAYGVDYE